MRAIAFAFSLGPILFGIGFLAPVLMAAMDMLGVETLFGLKPLPLCIGVGATLGLIARQRRTWLW